MTTLNTTRPGTDGAGPVDYDAVVIGAGFGGLYMLHKLRDELGLSVRAYDRAGGVGGTWKSSILNPAPYKAPYYIYIYMHIIYIYYK